MANNDKELNDEQRQIDEKNKIKRIEEAKKIASKSQEIIDSNYNALARRFLGVFRMINSRLDFILTNSLSAKIVSLALAILLYFSVNYSGDINVFGQNNVGKNIYAIPVKAIYDADRFQIENLPTTVDLSLVGSVEAIRKTEVLNQQEVIIDLSSFEAGLNQKVQLLYSGIADGVTVKFSQPVYEVNIFERKSKKFTIAPELIRIPINDKFRYEVNFNQRVIEIKAAQHTLDQIASVRALVDVSSQEKNFEQMATLVVMDREGNKIEGLTLAFDQIKVNVIVQEKEKGE